MRIYLVGFMGAGKTEVGRLLAERLEFDFVDLDEYLVGQAGMTIRDFFERFGEDAFRLAERQALQWTTGLDRTVIATGGGAFCSESNRDIIHADGGRSVFLDVPWPVLADRLGGDQSARPKLTSLDRAGRLYFERRRHYECASITVASDGLETADEVAAFISASVSPGVPCGT